MNAAVIIPAGAALVGSLYTIAAMRRTARERYGLYLVGSISFGLFFLMAIFGLFAYGNFYGLLINGQQFISPDQHQGLLFLFASLISGYFGLSWNVVRSNPPFGLLFSLCQIVLACSVLLIFVWLITRRRYVPPVPGRVGL